jgi:acyl carrier protein
MIDRQGIIDSVIDRLTEVLVESNSRRPDEHTDLRDLPGLDSLGILELLVWLEERFSVAVPVDELIVEKFTSVAKIADYVMTYTSPGQAP